MQPPLSLVHRGAAVEILPGAARAGMWALVYSPLESGLLAGRFSRQRVEALPDGDWRRRRPLFQAPRLQRTLALVERLRPLADELGVSLAALAIAWTLSWPGVTGAIAGARTPAQVQEWIGAAALRLDDATLDAIADALAQTRAGIGPRRPPRTDPAPARGMDPLGVRPQRAGR